MFTTLIVMMLSRVYMYVKTYLIAHLNYVHFIMSSMLPKYGN